MYKNFTTLTNYFVLIIETSKCFKEQTSSLIKESTSKMHYIFICKQINNNIEYV